MKMRTLAFLMAVLSFATTDMAVAQSGAMEDTATTDARQETGGAQTLDDILARQRGEEVADKNNSATDDTAAGIAGALGHLGEASDAEIFRALRYGHADVKVSSGGPEARVLMQDGGMKWLEWRSGPLRTYGTYMLLGMIALLALFYLIRGKVRIEGGKSGQTIQRFNGLERFGHWLMAGSFIVLGITGLVTLFGRVAIIPYLGKEAFAPIAIMSKWVHNNVSWAFMLGLVMIFLFWVLHNLPSRHDIGWLLKGGGLFSKHSHPPSKKFNAGQKIIFWSVILLGGSISVTGLSLLFPFELPLFAQTFAFLRDMGIDSLPVIGTLPVELAPQEEMQFSQLWHALISFVLMAIIIAHIYIGTLGMEGAYDAMGSGEVDVQWAKEHHSIWAEEALAKQPIAREAATPAE